MGEEQGVAGNQVGGDLLGVELALHLVRGEYHDEIRLLDGLRHGHHAQSLRLGLRDGLRPGPQPDPDVDPGVTQTQRMGVSLGAVADDGDAAVLDDGQVGIRVVEHLSHFCFLTFPGELLGLVIGEGPGPPPQGHLSRLHQLLDAVG